ncbi:MAG: hypothetical protein WAU11_02920 [Ignavibacteriaceae bacterium]
MLEKILLSILSKLGFELVKKLFSNQDPSLNDKMRKAINNSIEKFKEKYSTSTYGDVNNNFLASQQNFDKFLESIDYDMPSLSKSDLNPTSFDGTSSVPEEVVEDFITIINQEIKNYPELHILKAEKAILEELKEVKSLLQREPINPKFVNHKTYFNNHERHLSEISATQIERFKEYLDQIQSFFESEENILLLCGKGGNGKSHILRELNSIIQDQHKLIFVQPNIRSFNDAFQDELSPSEKYVFVFDDAERYLEEIPALTSIIKSRQRDFKLVLTFRPSGKNSIEKIIYDYRLEDVSIKLNLLDWKIPELVQLLNEMKVSLDDDKKILIAQKYPNPYLITWIGRQIRGETTISIEKIREKFIGDIKREVENDLKDILSNPLEFLIDLTIIVPFNLNDENLIKNLSTRYSISIDIINHVVNLLIEVGILRRIGETIRFDPDMRGDLLLYYYLENNDELSNELLKYWLPVFPEKVFINIQSLSRYFTSSTIKDFCSMIINGWIDEAENSNGWERISNLKLLSYIAYLIPEQSINLLNVYLSSPASSTKKNQIYNFEPSTDDYGPVLISLMWLIDWREHLLDIILILTNKKIGIYDNYKPNRLIQELISPLHHKSENIIKTLEKIELWLQKPSSSQIELVEHALTETLASAHEVIESYGNMIKILELPLKLTNEIVLMRKKALELLIMLINSNESELILIALRISKQIGDSKMRRFPNDKIPLTKEIIEERKSVVQVIGQLLNQDLPLKVLQEIEDLFLHWYAAETLGTEEVVDFLISFPRTIEYLVFKSFVEPHFLITDFQEIVNNAPNEKKWDWMFESYYNKNFRNNTQLNSKLAKELENKYSSPESTLSYLKELDNILTPLTPWNHPLIITEWIKINKEKFLTLKSDNEQWPFMPNRFKNEIDIELSKQNDEYIGSLAEDIFSNEINLDRIRTFLSVLQTKNVSQDKLIFWLSKLIDTNNLKVLEETAYCLWNIFSKYDLYEYLTAICIKLISPFDLERTNIFSNLDFSFDLIRKNREKVSKEKLVELAEISNVYLKNLTHLDYKHESILFLTFNNRIPSFVDFLIYRFDVENKDYRNFQAVPQGGFHKLKYIIDSKEKFGLLVKGIEKINEEISLGGLRLKDLNNSSISLVNEHTNRQYYVEYVEELMNVEILRAIKLLPFIADKEKNIQLIFDVADKGILEGYKENVINTYSSLFDNTSFSWGTEEFEKGKELFSKLKAKSKPGLHAKIIQDQIDYFDKKIKEFSRDDEDFYIPRG